MKTNTANFIKKMPKIKLHLHLEGAIPLETLFRFIKREKNTSIKNLEDLKKKFTFKDFPHFLKTWSWKNNFIKYEEDFEEITYEVLKSLSRQNVIYLEAFYSPGDFLHHGLTSQGITENIIKGKERAYKDFGIKCELIVDLIIDHGHETGLRRVKELTPYLGKGLIGIGLGGSENFCSAEPFEYVYKEAKKRGFRLTAHAGEATDAKSIWTVIKKLGVERIGHGIKAIEDSALMTFLKEKQLPLEICPVSNLKTGVTPSIERHPVRDFFDRGLMVTINSDDPEMFNTSITKEYMVLAKHLNFSIEEIKKLSINSIYASFMSNREKTSMENVFMKKWSKIEEI